MIPRILASLLLLTSAKEAHSKQCACTTDDVNVRSGASLHAQILTTLPLHGCLTYKEHTQTADGYTWVNVDYHGQDAWMAQTFVTIGACSTAGSSGSSGANSGVQLSGCPHIVTRSEWGARAPSFHSGHLPGIPKYAFIHHGASPGCHTKAECMGVVRSYQNYHMDTHQWPDIGYSFIVGEDGNVYEGRGWDEIGAHTLNYNSVGLGICIIGNFMDHVPNDAALNAVKQLIACGVANNKISSSYILHGHRDVYQTSCPGDKLYELIMSWAHFSRHNK